MKCDNHLWCLKHSMKLKSWWNVTVLSDNLYVGWNYKVGEITHPSWLVYPPSATIHQVWNSEVDEMRQHLMPSMQCEITKLMKWNNPRWFVCNMKLWSWSNETILPDPFVNCEIVIFFYVIINHKWPFMLTAKNPSFQSFYLVCA